MRRLGYHRPIIEKKPGAVTEAGKIFAVTPVWWCMNQRLLITSLALGLLFLALGGWLVQALRWPTRTLVASYR